MNNKREIEFDVLRIIAAIGVITTHVGATQLYELDVNSSDFIWLIVIRAAITWHVPIFVMISGRFFLDLNKKKSLNELFGRTIKHLMIAFIIWSAIYTSYHVAIAWNDGNNILAMYKEFIIKFATGEYHLWYLFMIIGLYIASPIFLKIAEDKRITEYYIVIFIVMKTLQTYGTRIPIISVILNEIFPKMNFDIAFGYGGYFLLGYYLYTYGLPKKIEKMLLIATPVMIIFSCIGATVQSMYLGEYSELFFSSQTPNVIIESCGIYWLFIKKIKIKSGEAFEKIVTVLGKWGLGIYLGHVLVLELVSFLGFRPTLVTPIIGMSIMTTITFLISVLVVFILSKIPVLNKYMI